MTFVDPAIGRSAPLDPSGGQGQTPGGVVQGRDIEQQLSFRTAVEASALCEMEQALQVSDHAKLPIERRTQLCKLG